MRDENEAFTVRPTEQISVLKRLRQLPGQTWWSCVRLEGRHWDSFFADGCPPKFAKAVLTIKLMAIGVLLYVNFLGAVIVTIPMALAWLPPDRNLDEWDGVAGPLKPLRKPTSYR